MIDYCFEKSSKATPGKIETHQLVVKQDVGLVCGVFQMVPCGKPLRKSFPRIIKTSKSQVFVASLLLKTRRAEFHGFARG